MVLYGYDASTFNAISGSKNWNAYFNDIVRSPRQLLHRFSLMLFRSLISRKPIFMAPSTLLIRSVPSWQDGSWAALLPTSLVDE